MNKLKNNNFSIEKEKAEEIEFLENYSKEKLRKIEDSLHFYSISKNNLIDKIKSSNKNKDNNDIKIKSIENKIKDKYHSKKNKKIKIQKYFRQEINNVKNRNDVSLIKYKYYQLLRPFTFIRFYHKLIDIINKNKLLLIIALISIFAGATINVFFTKNNILNNILKGNLEVGIMAVGMTFVILTGGIDLSVGSMLGFLSIFIAKGYIVDKYSIGTSILLGFLIAILLGLFQGLLVARLKLPPFIVTLVGLLGYRGLAKILAKSKTYTVESDSLYELNIGNFLGIPNLVWIIIALVILAMVVLKFTKYGRNVYATGGNERAARLSGVKTWVIIASVYLVAALSVLIATISYTARVGSINPETGTAMELDVISAVVLGGTSLTGGKGGVGKTIIGWLVISTLSNVLNLLGYEDSWQLVFKGIIILAAVILDKNYNFIFKAKKIWRKII